MEKCKSVDHRQERVDAFVDRWRVQLRQQGTIVPSYRHRGARRTGPYYRLVCRDDEGRQRSVYLGFQSEFIAEVQHLLAALQQPSKTAATLRQARRAVRRALSEERRNLDRQLALVGLRRQGAEIRGWRAAATHQPGGYDTCSQADRMKE